VSLALLITVLYIGAAWAMLRSVETPRLDWAAWSVLAFALAGHTAILVHELRTVGPWAIGIFTAASLLGWTLAVISVLIALDRKSRALAGLLIVCAAVAAAGTQAGAHYTEAAVPGWELTAHIVLSIGAAALLFAAAITAGLLVLLDRRLRARRLADLPATLPPLDALEIVLFRLIGAGFALLTLSLVTGFVFVTNLFAQHLIHKTVLSIIAWIVFAILLAGRARFGWRGRVAQRWTLSGFAILLLAYFGSKFVLEQLLGRHWG
jgi:ABC-type uncharacterized transport system permease subunit